MDKEYTKVPITEEEQERLVKLVTKFYEEMEIDKKAQIPWHQVPARMVLFAAWLQTQAEGKLARKHNVSPAVKEILVEIQAENKPVLAVGTKVKVHYWLGVVSTVTKIEGDIAFVDGCKDIHDTSEGVGYFAISRTQDYEIVEQQQAESKPVEKESKHE